MMALGIINPMGYCIERLFVAFATTVCAEPAGCMGMLSASILLEHP